MLVSKKYFAARCGMNTKKLAVYIQRGKVITQGDEISVLEPQNDLFFRSHASPDVVATPWTWDEDPAHKKPLPATTVIEKPAETQLTTPAAEPAAIPPEAGPKSPPTAVKSKRKAKKPKKRPGKSSMKVEPPIALPDPEKAAKSSERFDVETAKKKAEVQRLSREVAMQDMKLHKLMGRYIPSDLVRSAFTQLFRSMTVTLKFELDTFILSLHKRKGLSQNDIAEIRGEMVTMMNRAINGAVDDSKKKVGEIVDEYSQQTKTA